MNNQQETMLIQAPLHRVQQTLLDPLALPEWNPAFLTISGPANAATGVRYPIAIRGGLRGYFEYQSIEAHRIDTTWHVPGFTETGRWQLEPYDETTVVIHGFQHQGTLARILSRGFDGVAELRLNRLAQRLQNHATDV